MCVNGGGGPASGNHSFALLSESQMRKRPHPSPRLYSQAEVYILQKIATITHLLLILTLLSEKPFVNMAQ